MARCLTWLSKDLIGSFVTQDGQNIIEAERGRKMRPRSEARLLMISQPPILLSFETEAQARRFARKLEKLGRNCDIPIEWALGRFNPPKRVLKKSKKK